MTALMLRVSHGIFRDSCDIVATEKQWRHLAQPAGIPDRYNTVVLDNLGTLPQHLL